jgi:hypothetical protein
MPKKAAAPKAKANPKPAAKAKSKTIKKDPPKLAKTASATKAKAAFTKITGHVTHVDYFNVADPLTDGK